MSSSSRRRKSNPSIWTTLPRDILEDITSRVDTRTEILYLRAVCKAWRSLIPFPPHNNYSAHGKSPLKLPSFLASPSHFLLKENTIYCFEPLRRIYSPRKGTRNWFVKIQETKPGKVRLKDSFNRLKIHKTEMSLLKVLNLLDYRVREVGKEYFLEFVKGKSRPREFSQMKKVVVGRKKKGGHDDFAVMAIHVSGSLRVWKMGEDKWVEIENRYPFKDVAYHKSRFYAMDSSKGVIAIDSSSMDVTQVVPPIFTHMPPTVRTFSYLVESLGDLYLFGNYDNFGPRFNVFKLDEEQGKWEEDNPFGSLLRGRAMFVGNGCSFSVPTRDFHGCLEKCIYFVDDSSIYNVEYPYPGWDARLFDSSGHTFSRLSSVAGYSELFWPPPIWLKQTTTRK